MPYRINTLRPALRPYRLHFYPTLGSTSNQAARLRRDGRLFAPSIILCGRQTAGRGRGSNAWWSSAGCVTATFVLPIHDRIPPQQMPLLAGLAVRQTCVELCSDESVQLKWPNDLWHNGRKLAGLLCERISKADLVGIGLNVNLDPSKAPRYLREKITSLSAIAGSAMDMNQAVIGVARNLAAIVRARLHQPFSVFVREIEKHHALSGKTVTILPAGGEPAIIGRCEGIDDEGRLKIRRRKELHRIVAGTVLLTPAREGAMTINLPALVTGLVVGVYWGRVLQLIRKMRRRVGNFANVIPAEKTGKLIRIVWIPLTILWIALPIAAGITNHLPRIFLPLVMNPWLAWLAAAVALAAFLFTLVCWQKMGKSWRLGIDPGEKTVLIVTGIYAHIRHPIYALSSLLMLATAAADPSPAMLAVAIAHLALLQFEARREEAHLVRVHGQAYLDYLAKTGRFVPKF